MSTPFFKSFVFSCFFCYFVTFIFGPAPFAFRSFLYADTLDAEILKGFTDMFKFYSRYRHPYMHATARDFDTSIIESRDIAEEKLKEVLISMKAWYGWYSEKK